MKFEMQVLRFYLASWGFFIYFSSLTISAITNLEVWKSEVNQDVTHFGKRNVRVKFNLTFSHRLPRNYKETILFKMTDFWNR